MTIALVSGAAYYVARIEDESATWALRIALWGALGGLVLYLMYSINLPGASWLREHIGRWTAGMDRTDWQCCASGGDVDSGEASKVLTRDTRTGSRVSQR